MKKSTYCYWSVGSGEFGFLLQTLVESARRVGVTEDFHVFSDRKIRGAFTHQITKEERKLIKYGERFRFDFKIRYLNKIASYGYDYVIYIDADSVFIRNPGNLLKLLQDDAAHMFFETNLAEPNGLRSDNWWGIPHRVLIESMHEMGVKSGKIYHVNGGFFMIQRDCVEKFTQLIHDFWHCLYKKGYKLNIDEPLLAYAMQMLCEEPEKHLLRDNLDVYGLWYEKSFNPEGQPFLQYFFLSGKEILANPAIVHCITNKPLMIKKAMNGRERLFYDCREMVKRAAYKPIEMLRKICNIQSNPSAWALERVEPS